MSHDAHASAPKGFGTRLVQATSLVLLFGLLYAATRAAPELEGTTGTIAAVGFLLLAGTLMSELVETINIPHLTGYLAAGILAGPYVFKLIDHETVERLTNINALALCLIALEGGAELRLATLKQGLRSLAWATTLQSLLVLVGMTAIFVAARPFMPFLASLSATAVFGVALLWGAISITRSPSAALGILSQTRATGPVATFTLTFVMASDIIVVILLATCMTVAKSLILPGVSFSFDEFNALGREILGTVALGTTLGLTLAVYMRLVGKQLIVVFVALGFGLTEVMKYLQFDSLLAFMVAGFVVQNLSKQGEKFIHAIQGMGSIIYVIFFATAGAHLDMLLLRKLWPVAVLLATTRMAITLVAGRAASRLANDPPILRRWGWAGLVSQAGLALGMAGVVARAFPSFGAGFRALGIATIALNEMFGPILFKFALDRAGETSGAVVATRTSLPPRASLPPREHAKPS